MTKIKNLKKLIFLAIIAYLNISVLALAANNESGNEKKSVIITFSKKPYDYKNIIKSVGGEITNDYSIIEGVSVKISEKDISKLSSMGNVLKVQEDKKVTALLHDSATLISANDVWGNGITGKDVKVCILDTGIDYKHPALDPNCRVKEFLNGTVEPYTLKSPDPYPTYYNYTWNITKSGYTSIAVHFVNISVEKDYDFIYIKDANWNTVQTLTGELEDVWSVSVPGNTIRINLVSDSYGCLHGFYLDKVINGSFSKKLENCTKIIGGYDFVNKDNDPMDDDGHGTHVAGIISSNDGYSRGIANGTKLLVAKVLDSAGSGTYSNVIAGIDWCVNNSAQVMSMSFGSSPFSGNCDNDELAKAVNSAVDKGVIAVAAAGNEGTCGIGSPGCASKVITVGATDKNNNIAGYSSKGFELDIVAPGSHINSTYFNGNWVSMSGTSMSAPHVSGVVALMLEANPLLSPSFVKDVITSTADPVNVCYNSYENVSGTCTRIAETEIPCTERVRGAGIINASRAVDAVLGDFSAPRYSNIKEPTDPSDYSPNAPYNFSIKWVDDKAVDKVIFEFNGENYTDLNTGGNVYYKTFYDLPVGFYTYKWYANDTSGKDSSTELLDFTIKKAPSTAKLLLNNLEGNVTVKNQTTVNITASSTGEGIIKFFENGTLINDGASPLTNLRTYEEGLYNITILYNETENYTSSFKTNFITVKNDIEPPNITISSPQNKTYDSTSMPLNFVINEPTSWIGYSLDGKSNVTITGNATLNLVQGSHNVVVYANDISGNVGSQKSYFTVRTSMGGCGGPIWLGCRYK